MYDIIRQYPCKVKKGDKLQTVTGAVKEIKRKDGRFIYFKDGSQYSLRHPDLVALVQEVKEPKEEEPVEEVQPQEEPAVEE
jgi:ribosomal protein L14